MSVYTNPQVCVAIPKFSQVTCQGRYLWFALYLLPQFLSLGMYSFSSLVQGLGPRCR